MKTFRIDIIMVNNSQMAVVNLLVIWVSKKARKLMLRAGLLADQ